jgi:hypothetical protein
VHGFGVNNVSDPLSTIQALERSKQYTLRVGLSRSRRTDHHQPVLDLLDLVQLENLIDPLISDDEVTFRTNACYVTAQNIEVDGLVIDAGEDIC